MFGGISRFLFSILQQRDRLKYPAVAKILSKDINPANAAISAVRGRWLHDNSGWRELGLTTLTAKRRKEEAQKAAKTRWSKR